MMIVLRIDLISKTNFCDSNLLSVGLVSKIFNYNKTVPRSRHALRNSLLL